MGQEHSTDMAILALSSCLFMTGLKIHRHIHAQYAVQIYSWTYF